MKKDREEDAELERIRGRGWEVEAEDEETTAGQKRLCMVFIVAVVVDGEGGDGTSEPRRTE